MTTAQRVVVDPITRIEGHLRIEAETDASGKITRAYSAGTMVRGIEIILRGRDPRDAWAFAQRICGVCTLVHGIASVRSVEDALHRAIPSYSIPQNAELIRNLMIAAQFVHDHVMHFYHLHALDWVDVVSALKADPKATSTLAQSISGYSKSSPGYFADVQKKVKSFVEQGQLGIFANAYWGHPAYKLPPEANLMAVCGSHPVSSVVRIGGAENGLRYLHCALCSSEWHVVRAKCSNCDNTRDIGYYHLEGGNRVVEAESCPECQTYLKVVHQGKDPQADPVADDLASLTLDLLMDETGHAKSGINWYLIQGQL